MVKTDLPLSVDSLPRVALFADTFFEANGVGTLTRQLVAYAQARDFPFMLIRGSDRNASTQSGSLETLELKRSPASFPVEKTLYFDPLLIRHKDLVADHIRRFKPDLIHITGPGDVGFLGVWVAHNLGLPSVASWHTNVHEYLSRRLHRVFNLMPQKLNNRMTTLVEQQTLRGLLRFYRTARFTMAPNQTMVDLLRQRTGRPSHLMLHGVDLASYHSETAPECERDKPFCIGYVGRLTTEKNVQAFVEMEQRLLAAGEKDFRFLIVGEGGQQKWLRHHLQQAEMPGVLRGADLAAAYRRMDVLVFPSLTDTFGLVLLEAMASGVPVILSPETGKRVGVEDGVSGLLTHDLAASVKCLIHDPGLRQAMGAGARRFAETQSWDSVFDHLYQTYAHALSVEHAKLAAVTAP